MQNCY